jgi:hypothetical protein
MSARPLSLLAVLLLAPLSAVAVADKDAETRKAMVNCINKDIVASNAEWKLPPEDLKKFTDIIDRGIMKESLAKKTPEEQKRILGEIKSAARKELPHLDADKLDKMLETLKQKGMHCGSLAQGK